MILAGKKLGEWWGPSMKKSIITQIILQVTNGFSYPGKSKNQVDLPPRKGVAPFMAFLKVWEQLKMEKLDFY